MQLYKISFKETNKCYIGITSRTIQDRFREHCYKSTKTIIANAIRKYGKENAIITVLAEYDSWELMCLAEIEAIEKYNTISPFGYNKTSGGDGVLMSDEQKIEHSNILKQYYIDNPEHINKLKIAIKNTYVDNPEKREAARLKTLEHYENHPETLEKMSNAQKELYKYDPTNILNLAISNKKLWDDDIDGEKRRKYGERMRLFFKENPSVGIAHSERMKAYFSNEENRIKQSERLIEFHKNNPDHGIRQSIRVKERFSKESERQAQSERKLLFFKNNPNAGKEHSERMKIYFAEHPEIGNNHSKVMKARFNDNPELKKEHGDKIKSYYINNPIARIRASVQNITSRARKNNIPFSELPKHYFKK